MTIINRGVDRPTGLCTASVPGRNLGCQHPRVESADASLCARHLLIAASDVKQIGTPYLMSLVRQEQALLAGVTEILLEEKAGK